jgi:hypothetical protein
MLYYLLLSSSVKELWAVRAELTAVTQVWLIGIIGLVLSSLGLNRAKCGRGTTDVEAKRTDFFFPSVSEL